MRMEKITIAVDTKSLQGLMKLSGMEMQDGLSLMETSCTDVYMLLKNSERMESKSD